MNSQVNLQTEKKGPKPNFSSRGGLGPRNSPKSQFRKGGFPKLGVPFFGVPILRTIISSLGSILGYNCFGKLPNCCRPRRSTYTTIRELGAMIPSVAWYVGPNSLIVVYMDPLGERRLWCWATPRRGQATLLKAVGLEMFGVWRGWLGPGCKVRS